ncbi:hypothetical protein CCR75_008905 [Bremia lactucae]|uniref:Uncharacterized protein n=1 Tax=Bremia lactucae TaxID=4779 RepID=A0A976FQQ4_BRELC|nr:hypothetical protein CCR75_008905 [Bremia lactucae]
MFNTWDLVRPRFWYPMSSLEQSMMDLEHMYGLMSHSRFPFDMNSAMLAAPSAMEDDDFFKDLPVLAREQQPATQHREESVQLNDKKATTNDSNQSKKGKPRTSNPNQQNQMGSQSLENDNQRRRAFSSYTFSNSSIVDNNGRRVTSMRRRYEDSTGRLKAVHERQVEGKKLRTTWSRMTPDDKGQHEALCSSGTPDEFEALWQQTPFGEAQKKTIKDQQTNEQQRLEQDKQSNAEATSTPMES